MTGMPSVLLLIITIQKDNQDIIETIQNLDTKTKRDIMYFYTSGVQKVGKEILRLG